MLLFLLADRRIREAQKHVAPVDVDPDPDSDPEHCSFAKNSRGSSPAFFVIIFCFALTLLKLLDFIFFFPDIQSLEHDD